MKIRISRRDLLAAAQVLGVLAQYVRPGALGLLIGTIRKAILDAAQPVHDERSKLVEELAEYQGEGDARRPVAVALPNGGADVRIDPSSQLEFNKRERELLAGHATIEVERLLTVKDVEALTGREARKLSKDEQLPPIDFAFLLPVMSGHADVVEGGEPEGEDRQEG